MSYEGVEQLLCEKGHYSVHDVHSPHKPDICFCGARFVWMNSVDYTNGTHDEDGNRIDGYVELELSDEALCDKCGSCLSRRFKVPKKGGVRL